MSYLEWGAEQKVVICGKCPMERVCKATDPELEALGWRMRRGGEKTLEANVKSY